jgi:hypothetical protein
MTLHTFFDGLIDFMGSVVNMGTLAYSWLFSDLYIGNWNVGKPVVLIGTSLFFVIIAFWIKNKVMGDLG